MTMRNFHLPGIGYAGNGAVDLVRSQRSLPLVPGSLPLCSRSARGKHKATCGSHAPVCPEEKGRWRVPALITQTLTHSSLEGGEKSWLPGT